MTPSPPQSNSLFHSVETALEDLQLGRLIIVVDDENRENEGDLIGAAQFATPQMINFMATQARGLICLAMQGQRLDELQIPLMVHENTDNHQTAFTVSIDAGPHLGVTTGISAADRSRTIQAIINPQTQPQDLRRPGHIFPLRAKSGGVLKRAGHTEAAVDLCLLSGLYPAGVICEIQNLDGSMARLPQLMEYSSEHDLKIITIASLIEYRLHNERFVQRQTIAKLPSEFGEFQVYGYRNTLDNSEHVALVKGDPTQFQSHPVLVRVHTESLLEDALGSLRSDSRRQLELALRMIERQGEGVVVYLRQTGADLLSRIKTYGLQDLGLENTEPSRPTPDLRNYGVGAQILRDLGVRQMRLITNTPRKISGLKGFGLSLIERVPLLLAETDPNLPYLVAQAQSQPLIQTYLLTLAVYPAPPETDHALPQALWRENLRRMAAAEELWVQDEERSIGAVVFGSTAILSQIGLDHEVPEGLLWFRPHPPSEQPQTGLRSVLRLLLRLSQTPGLQGLAWVVSMGADPLANLREELKRVDCKLQDLSTWGELGPQWQEQTLYHLRLSSESGSSPQPQA